MNEFVVGVNKNGGNVPSPKNFDDTMSFIRSELPGGIAREKRPNITPINLYEAVAVGAALALLSGKPVKNGILDSVMNNPELQRFTTAGTNSRSMVRGRIEYVRDRLIG